jgi:hypothetical protein
MSSFGKTKWHWDGILRAVGNRAGLRRLAIGAQVTNLPHMRHNQYYRG